MNQKQKDVFLPDQSPTDHIFGVDSFNDTIVLHRQLTRQYPWTVKDDRGWLSLRPQYWMGYRTTDLLNGQPRITGNER